MSQRIVDHRRLRPWRHLGWLPALAAAIGIAAAQTPPAPAGPDHVPPQQAPPQDNPGLINEIGKLLQKTPSLLPSLKLPDSLSGADPAQGGAAPPAAPAPAVPPATPGGLDLPLPRSLMVTGRTVCPASANGAPDCKIAADRLCQTKGFREGKSLDTDAAETCSPKVFIPGRKREPGDCKMDSFVTRAICQ